MENVRNVFNWTHLEHASFTPLIFNAYCGCSRETYISSFVELLLKMGMK